MDNIKWVCFVLFFVFVFCFFGGGGGVGVGGGGGLVSKKEITA